MKPAAFFGLLSLAAALGAVALGEAVLLPGTEANALLDANLSKALVGPVHARLAEVALAGSLVLAATVPRWLGSRIAMTAAILLVAAAAASRAVVVPALYEAWAHADLVAGRPAARLLEAERLSAQSHALALGMLLLLVAIAWIASRGTDRVSPAT